MQYSAAAIILILMFFVFVAFSLAYFYVLNKPNPQLKQAELKIRDAAFGVEVASTTLERARGLSGRDDLAENTGMLFLFDSPDDVGFWMKDMKFPLDMIWINGDTVAGATENIPAEPGVPMWNLKVYHPPQPVDKVFEVPAGTVKKYGIQAGDRVVFDLR
jgi:uncharacterized membrane protein (UPF0127 family)